MGSRHDGWRYQGRQYHQWFGHGTKPKDGAPPERTLQERIHDLGHTLVASVPRSQRHHAAFRLDPDHHARLNRVLHAAVRIRHASKAVFAAHLFDAHPDAPFVEPFRKTARVVSTAATLGRMHEASDSLGDAAMAVGLDRWRGFVRGADERVAGKADPAVILARGPAEREPFLIDPFETSPHHAGDDRRGRDAARMALAIIIAAGLLGIAATRVKGDDLKAVAAWFGLDLGARSGMQAAAAYLYVTNGNAAVLRHIGADGVDRAQAAEALLQAVRAKPDLLDDAVGGVPNGALDEVRQAIKAAVPDPVTENAEEETLKDAWRKAGMTNRQIAAALENLRERRKYDASGTPASDGRQPPAWIPAGVAKRFPERFGLGRDGKKAGAWRWEDPLDQGNAVRIDPGNPSSKFPIQQVDHVIVRSKGTVIGRDGKPINGSTDSDPVNAHIPLSDHARWRSWNAP